jgi:hypothetical protein
MNEKSNEDIKRAQEDVPSQRRREDATNLQPNDDPAIQEELTGEGVTAPDDTLGG